LNVELIAFGDGLIRGYGKNRTKNRFMISGMRNLRMKLSLAEVGKTG
jgi:hypothetical protein